MIASGELIPFDTQTSDSETETSKSGLGKVREETQYEDGDDIELDEYIIDIRHIVTSLSVFHFLDYSGVFNRGSYRFVSTLENPAGNDKSFTDYNGPSLSETGCFPRHPSTRTRVNKILAEPIGLASGLQALAKFAFQCSTTLHETVNSFRSHYKPVRGLLEELEALSAVLGPLAEFVTSTADIDMSALDLPLLRCGSACKGFQQEILQLSSRSDKGQPNFQDWARLKYMDDDIDGFQTMLAGYKATFNIALADANLRQSSVNTEILDDYKRLIQNTEVDLEDRLKIIDSKLECIVEKSVTQSEPGAAELQYMKEERLSTEKCLQICAQLSDHIDHIQLMSDGGGASHHPDTLGIPPETVTNESLQECKNNLSLTAARLEKHMQDTMNRQLSRPNTATSSKIDEEDLTRLQDGCITAQQCLDICSKADSHLKDNDNVIEDYGPGDGSKFKVSTYGDVLHAKTRAHGWRTQQLGGYRSEDTVQRLSRDIATINMSHLDGGEPHSTDRRPLDECD
ncbi:hypothetical protein EN45_025050 [Penicillium chrysogenum]|uniref:Pc13g00230 protein n=3 Tax=Penicillium chrysogenum species complex TaxID=254878 RepID=B6H5H6_PENRW|nr:hypothetical protein NUH16_010050 [Penicillium rubens]KZN92351.1 hypothetical protein EN45_025050 [Penicillium chrysogenum]CAP91092.1 Pc13g00230 [Penicillium rubens Wisconsin 54-1255]